MSTTVTIDDKEIKNHRQAVRDIREKCHGFDQWGCVEALLYMVTGDTIVERVCLWVFPNANERYLTSTSDENGGVDAYYILGRLEGKSSFDKISQGVCRNHAGTFSPFSSTTGASLGVDPTMGNVLRIISIEKDGDPLQSPEDASPFLSNARHIREVVREQAGKSEPLSESETLYATFAVLRTSEYINAREKMEEDDCSSEEWVMPLRCWWWWKKSLLKAERPFRCLHPIHDFYEEVQYPPPCGWMSSESSLISVGVLRAPMFLRTK